MVKASSLFLVVVLSLVIAIITGAFILAAFFNGTSIQKNLRLERLEMNANSGMELLLANPSSPDTENSMIFDLFGENRDSVQISSRPWGVFGVLTVKAFAKKDTIIKAALVGYKPNEQMRSAIYLADQNRPVSVCGNTEITGTAYLPEAGAKRGYIEGMGYISNTLVYGEIRKSASEIPKLSENSVGPIKKIMSSIAGDSIKSISSMGLDFLKGDTLTNSFLSPSVVIATNSKINLSKKNWKGQIILKSTVPVVVKSSCQLTDIQIYAPSIIVEDRYVGSVQLFAADSVFIGQNVHLTYPSSVCLVKNSVKKFQPFIQVSKYSTVSGLVFTVMDITDRVQARISVDENALVRGQIYTEGFAEIKGKVYGNVTTNKFILRTASSIYENHLLNATISTKLLPPQFTGSWMLPSEKRKRIIKWVF